MLDPFERAVWGFIQQERLLRPGERVVAAVSGGPDSTALLLVLKGLCAERDFELTAFHYNHQLRSASEQDEEFARDLCRGLKVDLQVDRGCVRQQAEQRGLNLEDWARRVRYRALIEVAQRLKATPATGHTLDDQAETVLLKLFRGAGPDGLSAIAARRLIRPAAQDGRAISVIRPLLGFRRQEVLDYLQRRGQGFRQDESNADLSLDRNWVRAELIPLLEERLNPNLVPTLGRNAQLWGQVGEWLNRLSETILEGCRMEAGDLLLPLQAMMGNPRIVQRSALREAVLRMRPASGLDPFSLAPEPARKAVRLAHIDALLRLAGQPPGHEIQLPGGLRAVREPDQLRLTLQGPTPGFCYSLAPPGEIVLSEVNKRLTLRECSHSEASGPIRLWLDSSPLKVRNRQPGDRYRPGKDSRARKLKDLLAQGRVPNALRDRLIVLESGGKLVWVEGFPPHPDCAVPAGDEGKSDPAGRKIFEIRLKLHNL